jgi:hypothetical protein
VSGRRGVLWALCALLVLFAVIGHAHGYRVVSAVLRALLILT